MRALENLKFECARCLLVMFERSGHRTTSPTVYWWKLVRAASVDAFWSQPSLRSRSGMGLSKAWPLLSRLYPAPLIPARPFGLRWRFDETPLVAPSRLIGISCQRYQAQPRNGRRVAYESGARKRPSPDRNAKRWNNEDWSSPKGESRIKLQNNSIDTAS